MNRVLRRGCRRSRTTGAPYRKTICGVEPDRETALRQFDQRAVVLPLRGAQERPIGRPHTMVKREGIDNGAHQRPGVFERVGHVREFRIAGQFDADPPGAGEPQQRLEAGLPQARVRRRPPAMVDQDAHRHGLDPGHEHQQLVVLALNLQKHVELGELADQRGRLLVVVAAMKGRVESRADDSLRFQSAQGRKIGIERDDGDAFEAAVAARDSIEHAGIVAAVAGIRLHQQRVADAVGLHDLAKLRRRADLLAGRLVFDILAVGKIDRIEHVDVAVDLWLFENAHRARSPCSACASFLRNARSRFKCHSRLMAARLLLQRSECNSTQTRPRVVRAPLPELCCARRRATSLVQPT